MTLEEQIEQMKNCHNCANKVDYEDSGERFITYGGDYHLCLRCKRRYWGSNLDKCNEDNWVLRNKVI